MAFGSYMKMIFGAFKPLPKSRATDMRELEKRLIAQYSSGEPSLFLGAFVTQEQHDALREKVLNYKFS